MTTQIDALKLAFEALKENQHLVADNQPHAYVMEYNSIIEKCEEILAQPEQKPVAWIHNFIDGGISIGKRPVDLNRHPDRWTALYKEPKPCPTCEALARTVMLDQTSHDTTPPHRKPLTDEQIDAVMPQPTEFGIVQPPWNGLDITILRAMARAIEAAHNIKE